AKVHGPFSAVQVTARRAGEFVLTGRGAGGGPTAVAVLSDILELARSPVRAAVPAFGYASLAPASLAGAADFVAPFALRFVVRDRPGIIVAIGQALAAHDINIDAVLQAPFADKNALPFVITIERVAERQLADALR